ncbi:MAG: NosD domain-containing protein [Candidatus Hodarchaeota archaeon]
MDNCSKFFKNPPGILTNEEGQGAKHHPFVRVLGIVLILSAVVSLASWGGSPTISGAHASNFHPPHLLDVESHRSRHNAVVHALPQQYVAHGPISINKNADFAAFDFPGKGSRNNPYVIAGLNIKSTQTLIHIQDTTAYFRIWNNLLTGVEWYSHGSPIFPYGIYLQNVVHGTIDTNIITNCKSGIHLNGSEQTSVSYNTVSNCKWPGGISLVESWNNNLAHNTLSDNVIGIRLLSSGQNTLVGNSLVNNGLDISGDQVEDCLQATVAENMVNGRPVVYWQSVSGGTVPPGAGQVLLIDTTGVEVMGQNLAQTSIGVLAAFSSHLIIHHNTLSNNSRYGIALSHSENSTMAYNTLSSNRLYGISLVSTRHITISNNTLSQNRHYGIDLMNSEHNTVTHNTFFSDGGIYFEESGHNSIVLNTLSGGLIGIKGTAIMLSWNNTIAHNTVSNGGWAGISLHYAEHNTVAHNIVANCSSEGILLTYSGYNTLFRNTITNCEKEGIGIWDSWHNNITNNIVANCKEEGIVIQWADSRNNMVTWNDFLGNNPTPTPTRPPMPPSQARDNSPNNVFTYNYWDDHDNTDRNGDGIADAPYNIGSNQDPFPLAVPANIPHRLSALTITYPTGGETLQGTITLHWTPTNDTWKHSVTYTVSYSADEGHPWILLASGLLTSEYEWDTTTIADGSAFRVQVVATCSDGLTAVDVSDAPFTIQNPVATTTVGTFPIPGMPVAMLLATLLLLLAMHVGRRGKRQAR